jgi:hypothetical protein
VICRVAEEFLLTGTSIFISGVGGLSEVDLTLDGKTKNRSTYDYAGMDTEEAAQCLIDALFDIYEKLNEKADFRKEIAELAKHTYSFRVMAQNLIPLILNQPRQAEANYKDFLSRI